MNCPMSILESMINNAIETGASIQYAGVTVEVLGRIPFYTNTLAVEINASEAIDIIDAYFNVGL
tara:strand:+ start:960 stop:1151 length:192 start_codon:yes stop_codon:yes gene_type:complete